MPHEERLFLHWCLYRGLISLPEIRSRSLAGVEHVPEVPWEEQLFCRADVSLEHHLRALALAQLGQDLWHGCGAAPQS